MNEAEVLQATATDVTRKVVSAVAQSVGQTAVDIFQKEADANIKAWTDVCNKTIQESKKVSEQTKQLLAEGEEVEKRFREMFPDLTQEDLEKETGLSHDQVVADIQKSIMLTPADEAKIDQDISQEYQTAKAKYLKESGISSEFDDLPQDERYLRLLMQHLPPLSANSFDAEMMELASAMNNFVAVKMQHYDADIQRQRELEGEARLRKAAAKYREHHYANHFWTSMYMIGKIAALGVVAWFAPPLLAPLFSSAVATAAATGVAVGATDAAVQGLGVGLKVQDHFATSEVLESTLSAGVGVAATGLSAASRIAASTATAVGTESVEVQLGLKEKFDIKAVALQGVTALVAEGLQVITPEMTQHLPDNQYTDIATTTAHHAVQAVVQHAISGAPINVETIATQVAGNVLGSKMGKALTNALDKKAFAEKKSYLYPRLEDTQDLVQELIQNLVIDQKSGQYLSSADIDKGLSTTCLLLKELEVKPLVVNPMVDNDVSHPVQNTSSLPGLETIDKVTSTMLQPKPLFKPEWKIGARAMGALEAAGGAVETSISTTLALATAETGAGILFFGPAAISGLDHVITGVKTAITGEEQKTHFVQAAQQLGIDSKTAACTQAALDLASTVQPIAWLKSARAVGTFFAKSGVGEKGLGLQTLHHSEIKFSQSSVNNIDIITESMTQHGWNGAPIDVVRMSDGTLITVDNTRLLAASRTNTLVQAIVHDANTPLTAELAERFTTKQGGTPSTWGEAIMNRINKQNNLYRDIYPNGSRQTGAK